MPWIQIHIATTASLANTIGDQLAALGAESVTFLDAGDQPLYEPSQETPRIWEKTMVVGLFPADFPIESVPASIKEIQTFTVHELPDEDWERRCLADFNPICCGKRLWICPSWHEPPDPHAINVILDPGLAFGTGTHPTTALCLAWLDENLKTPELVIDYGCGSGILAIAALALGAKKVVAVDNDPQALLATEENAKRNQIKTGTLITQLPNEPILQKVDILIANILAEPLIELSSYFAKIIPSGGKILLSGILYDQIDQIISSYAQDFVLKSPKVRLNWVCIEGLRK